MKANVNYKLYLRIKMRKIDLIIQTYNYRIINPYLSFLKQLRKYSKTFLTVPLLKCPLKTIISKRKSLRKQFKERDKTFLK